jgi:hypothetical protein
MKTKGLIIVVILLVITNSSYLFSQNTPFKSWLKDGIVGSTYITRSMLDMVPDMRIGNMAIIEFGDALEQVEIYTNAKNKSHYWQASVMEDQAITIVTNEKYELLMQLSEDNTSVAFYAKRLPDNKEIVKDLVMIRSEEDPVFTRKCQVIRIVGEFFLDDIRNVTKQKKK